MLAIKAGEDSLEAFNNMKLGKKTAYLLFKVDGANVVVDKAVEKADAGTEDYLEDFIKAVKESGEPRFAVVD
jgi:predicted peroxiredoxin